MAQDAGASLVLLAHHRRDQAETVLLQALRGAGVAGWSGMPRLQMRQQVIWARPWLAQPREAIEAYVARHRLSHVNDVSNADTRFARNRLRHEAWPALQGAFPQAEAALSQCALWAQDANANLAELAALDLQQLQADDGALNIKPWRSLAPARQRNALRHWFRAQTGQWPTANLVERVMAEAIPPQGERPIRWEKGLGELRLYRGRLKWVGEQAGGELTDGEHGEATLVIDTPGRYPLPGWQGVLWVEPALIRGVPAGRLSLRLAARTGGERFQLAPQRPARALKKQFQAGGVPAWERAGPLLWRGSDLLFVPGLGINARHWAATGEPQWTLRWEAVAT